MLGLWATSASLAFRKTLSSTCIWTVLSHSTPDLLPALRIYTTEKGKQMYMTPSLSPSKLLQKRFTKTYESKGVFIKPKANNIPLEPIHQHQVRRSEQGLQCLDTHYCLQEKVIAFSLAFILIKSLAAWGVFSWLVIGVWDYRKPLNQPPFIHKRFGGPA